MSVSPQPPESLDPQRQTAQQQLERAVGEGRLTLDEFIERSGLVWGAATSAEIDKTLADLPAVVVGQTAPARSWLISIIGDVRRRGRWSLRRRTSAVLLIGDIELDLRGAVITEEGPIEIDVYSLIGDVEVIAPEGVEVELGGFSVLGDRRIDLAPVPRVPGTPTVRVRVFSVIGDAKLRSAR